MDDNDVTTLHLDVYMTRDGPWNPAHGEIEIPDEWEFLPSGDAFVTRRVKAAGAYWVAWRPRGRKRPHRRRLGLWAPQEAIETAWAEAEDTEAQRAKQREQSAHARETQEAVYRNELEDAIRRFLAFPPEHADLADRIAGQAAIRAAEVGSGRVGRTRTLPLDERAALAVRALIRHRYTSYEDDLIDAWNEDDLIDAWVKDPRDEDFRYRETRAEALRSVDTFLARHRESPDQRPPDRA